MKVFALVSGAAALYVIHAHGHCVIVGVDHCAVGRVGKPAVCLSARAVAALVLTTHLRTHTNVRCHSHGCKVCDGRTLYLCFFMGTSNIFGVYTVKKLVFVVKCNTGNY